MRGMQPLLYIQQRRANMYQQATAILFYEHALDLLFSVTINSHDALAEKNSCFRISETFFFDTTKQ